MTKEKNSIQKADVCFANMKLSLAKFYYNEAKKDEAKNVYVWAKELETLILMGDEIRAIKVIEEMKRRFPDEYYPWHIEYILKASKEEAEVESLLQNAEVYFMNNINFQYDKFIFYAGTKRYLEAIKIAEDYLVENEEMITKIAEEMSDVYYLLGDMNKAKNILTKALSIDNNIIFAIKLIQMHLQKGDYEKAKQICYEIQDEQDELIIRLVKKMVLAYFLEDSAEKNVYLNDVITFCKASTLFYPYRLCLDLLCAIAYYIMGDNKNALDMLEYISLLSDDNILDVAKLKAIIEDKHIVSLDDEKHSINIYIWEVILKLYAQYRDGEL